MTVDDVIWFATFLAIALVVVIVWRGIKRDGSSRGSFVGSLSAEDQKRLEVHELLGGDWKDFERELALDRGNDAEVAMPQPPPAKLIPPQTTEP